MPAVPLSVVKEHLNLTASDQDAEVLDTIDRAEAILAEHVGPLSPVTVVDEVHTGPGPILLRRSPVISVVSATTSGATVVDADLDAEAGLLYGSFGPTRRGVKVTYQAGRAAPLPGDLEAAVLEMVEHLWESQRVPMQGGRPGFGGDFNPEVPGGAKYLLPYRVQTLIEPHRRFGLA